MARRKSRVSKVSKSRVQRRGKRSRTSRVQRRGKRSRVSRTNKRSPSRKRRTGSRVSRKNKTRGKRSRTLRGGLLKYRDAKLRAEEEDIQGGPGGDVGVKPDPRFMWTKEKTGNRKHLSPEYAWVEYGERFGISPKGTLFEDTDPNQGSAGSETVPWPAGTKWYTVPFPIDP